MTGLLLFLIWAAAVVLVGRWVAQDARRYVKDIPVWVVVIAVVFTFPLGLWGWLLLRSFYSKKEPTGERGDSPRSP